jgi:hypothetical protein
MKELLTTIGGLLSFALVLLFIQFLFDPKAAQESMITVINVVANVWHAAGAAFGNR